jgi:hypothetical protein
MSARGLSRTATRLTVALTLLLVLATAGTAQAARSVTFTPSFSAGTHLGEGGTFTAAYTFTGTEYDGQVYPLTSLKVLLPGGVGGSSAGFPVCTRATLEQIGPYGCPAGSLAGPLGEATMFVAFGGAYYEEPMVTIRPYFGPNETLFFFIEGHTPVAIEVIGTATYTSASSPYGRELNISLPYIETVPGAPYAVFSSLTLNLGAFRTEAGSEVASLTLPATCAGKFNWSTEVGFYEGHVNALGGESPCPDAGSRTPSSTALTASSLTPHAREAVTYTATVSPKSGSGAAPTGEVAFSEDGVLIPGCEAQPLSPGAASSSTATCVVSYPYGASYQISAEYGGNSTYTRSESGMETVEVNEEEASGGTGENTGNQEQAKTNTQPASQPGPAGGTPATAPPVITTAQIAAASLQELTPTGKPALIPSLLKTDGLSLPFKALEAGTERVQWFATTKTARGKARQLLLASGQLDYTAAAGAPIKVKLTAAGRALLKHLQRLQVTAKGTFTPESGAPTTVTKTFTLRR